MSDTFPGQFTPYEVDRGILPFVLVQRGLLGSGVEVGVCQGLFSEHILKHWPGFLHLVDSWCSQEDYLDAAYDHEANYQAAIERLHPYADRICIHRKPSVSASKAFEDGSLDFIYIDANHSYKACSEDLEAWYPKLKVGGLMAGDDYGIYPEQRVDFQLGDGVYTFGVKRAVDEFSLKHKKNISIDWLAGWAFQMQVNGENTQLFKARNWYFLK